MPYQQELFYRPAQAYARRSDPRTSHEAAAGFSEDKLTEIQRDVLDYFRRFKSGSDEDLYEYLVRSKKYLATQSTLRTRRSELVRKGLLRDSGKRLKNAGGHSMIMWELA